LITLIDKIERDNPQRSLQHRNPDEICRVSFKTELNQTNHKNFLLMKNLTNMLFGTLVGVAFTLLSLFLYDQEIEQPVLTITHGINQDADKVFINLDGEEYIFHKDALKYVNYMGGIIEIQPYADYVYYNFKEVK